MVNMNVSGLEGPACWSSMTRKEVGYPLDSCCCVLLALGSAEWVG